MVTHGHGRSSMCAYHRRMVDWSARPGIPRYVQVADIITAGIASGEYPPGWQLSEAEVAEEYGIARGTARKVFALLRQRELVFTVPSMGSYVGRPERAEQSAGDSPE